MFSTFSEGFFGFKNYFGRGGYYFQSDPKLLWNHFLLELLLEVKFNENIKLRRTVCGFWKSEAKVRIGAVAFKALPRLGGQRMWDWVS